MTNLLWFLVVVGGPLLLGIVIGVGMITMRRRTPQEARAQHEAEDRLYERK